MDRPWMAALEMQFAALTLGQRVTESDDPLLGSEKHKKIWEYTSRALRHADAYAWSAEPTTAVLTAAQSIPLSTKLAANILPSNHCWWWFETPLHVADVFKADETGVMRIVTPDRTIFTPEESVIKGLLISAGHFKNGTAGISFAGFGVLENKAPFPITYWTWEHGETLGDLLERQTAIRAGMENGATIASQIEHFTRFAGAACSWMAQKILLPESGHIERHRRKQLSREHDVTLSDVKIIQLRRAEMPPRFDTESSDGQTEWSCRWIVSGHWRNQWIPSTESHKLIYVMPYVKGPDDKPLKVPTHTVYSVTR